MLAQNFNNQKTLVTGSGRHRSCFDLARLLRKQCERPNVCMDFKDLIFHILNQSRILSFGMSLSIGERARLNKAHLWMVALKHTTIIEVEYFILIACEYCQWNCLHRASDKQYSNAINTTSSLGSLQVDTQVNSIYVHIKPNLMCSKKCFYETKLGIQQLTSKHLLLFFQAAT